MKLGEAVILHLRGRWSEDDLRATGHDSETWPVRNIPRSDHRSRPALNFGSDRDLLNRHTTTRFDLRFGTSETLIVLFIPDLCPLDTGPRALVTSRLYSLGWNTRGDCGIYMRRSGVVLVNSWVVGSGVEFIANQAVLVGALPFLGCLVIW
jgi:hypothetical protein